MATLHATYWRFVPRIALLLLLASAGGCAARAEYVYDEPVRYERRVYVAPPAVRYYRERPPEHRHYVAPRVYRAPVHVHRPPPAHKHHHHHDHHDRDDDDRRERRHRH